MNTVPSVTVIGAGNIGSAVAQIALKAGASVQVLTRDAAKAAAVSPQVSAGTIGEPVLGDIVVLAGKGHETYQEIRGVKHPFDEKVIVSELLEEIAGENRAE